MPRIPGFTGPERRDHLAALWTKPPGTPDELWPSAELRRAERAPVEWLTVVEHSADELRRSGTGCVLLDEAADVQRALQERSWLGRNLGTVGIVNGETFMAGLQEEERDCVIEFFAHVRHPPGSRLPHVEVSLPFLWYFDAFPVTGGWNYLNHAGRDQDLVRWSVTPESWKVEVRALEFRQFLAACQRRAVIQLDVVPMCELEDFERVDDEFTNDWASFDFCALHDGFIGDRPAFSRLLGHYVINGCRNERVPRFEERRQDRDYPTFIYEVDAERGTPKTHTCDPNELGTYFDKDSSRLHYLTPVYFRREVLQPYAAEPFRYTLRPGRLECLNLWGIDLSINSAGLVEVYLGDIGRDLPSDEWGHWRTYNVPPEGEMDEGRFRRDFLNQSVGSTDVVGDLRRARARAARAS